MLERLNEILNLLASEDATINGDQLGELETELQDIFDEIRKGNVEGVDKNDVETLRKITSAVELVRVGAAIEIEAVAAAETEIAEMEQQLRPVAADEDGDDDPPADDPEPEDPDVEDPPVAEDPPAEDPDADDPDSDDPPVVEVVDPDKEPALAATGLALPGLGQVKAQAPAQPARARSQASRMSIRGYMGQKLKSLDDVAELMAEAHQGFAFGAPIPKVKVATIRGEYAADRILSEDNSANANKAIIEAVCADAMNPDNWDTALLASGGFCAPTEVDYSLEVVAEAMRPFRDSLPGFRADRGGFRLAAPPTLADVDTSLGVDATAAVTVWDNPTDVNPGADTKGVQVIDCATFTDFLTAAIVRRLQFGNFGARAFPEQVRAWNDLVMAAHARVAETRLLDQVKALADAAVTTQVVFGTARDFKEAVIRAAQQWRSAQRMSEDRVLAVTMPFWVPSLGSIDLSRGLQSDPEFFTDGMRLFREGLAEANVATSFYVDSPSTGVSQQFTPQGDGELNPWPGIIQWGLWDAGHYVFLDGGELDLGIVRDVSTNETNDFQNFAETLEGIGKRGVRSLWFESNTCAIGESSAGVTGNVACIS